MFLLFNLDTDLVAVQVSRILIFYCLGHLHHFLSHVWGCRFIFTGKLGSPERSRLRRPLLRALLICLLE